MTTRLSDEQIDDQWCQIQGSDHDWSTAQLREFARAIESAVLPGWVSVKDRLPQCSTKPNSFGVPVLIYPPHKAPGAADANCAFFGTRVTDEPSFYLYGRCIEVTHWMPIPAAPEVPR